MVKTRFDESKFWTTSDGRKVKIKDMEASHIINTIKLFISKPLLAQTLLIKDIETLKSTTWSKKKGELDTEGSFTNITSMTLEETKEYIIGTPLVSAFLEELAARGVNTVQLITNILEDVKVEIKSEGK